MYAVQATQADTMETKVLGKFADQDSAIVAATEVARTVEPDEVAIAVFDSEGELIWDNEGDWQNAVR